MYPSSGTVGGHVEGSAHGSPAPPRRWSHSPTPHHDPRRNVGVQNDAYSFAVDSVERGMWWDPEFVRAMSDDLETFIHRQIELSEEERVSREKFIARLERIVRGAVGDVSLLVHGSFATGVALRHSDIDILVHRYGSTQPLAAIDAVQRALLGQGREASPSTGTATDSAEGVVGNESDAARDLLGRQEDHSAPIEGPEFVVQTIVFTRVPVVKVTERATGLKADLTFGGGDHEAALELTRRLFTVSPYATPLTLLLKHMLRSLAIGSSGLSSFVLYLLVSHFFQAMQRRQPLIVAGEVVGEVLRDVMRQVGDPTANNSAATAANTPPSFAPTPQSPAGPMAPPLPQAGASATSAPMDALQWDSCLGAVLFSFAWYYGSFDYDEQSLRFDPNGTSTVVAKPEASRSRHQYLSITSPFDPSRDIGLRQDRTRDFRVICCSIVYFLRADCSLRGLGRLLNASFPSGTTLDDVSAHLLGWSTVAVGPLVGEPVAQVPTAERDESDGGSRASYTPDGGGSGRGHPRTAATMTMLTASPAMLPDALAYHSSQRGWGPRGAFHPSEAYAAHRSHPPYPPQTFLAPAAAVPMSYFVRSGPFFSDRVVPRRVSSGGRGRGGMRYGPTVPERAEGGAEGGLGGGNGIVGRSPPRRVVAGESPPPPEVVGPKELPPAPKYTPPHRRKRPDK